MDTFRVERYPHTRFWAVRDAADTIVCVCVHKRGAVEVARRGVPVAPADGRDAVAVLQVHVPVGT